MKSRITKSQQYGKYHSRKPVSESTLFDDIYNNMDVKQPPLHNTQLLIAYMEKEWDMINEKLIEKGFDQKFRNERRKDWEVEKIKVFAEVRDKNYKVKNYQHTVISEYLEYLNGEIGKSKPRKISKLKSIALFCQLVDQSRLVPRGPLEDIGPYTRRICKKFDLEWRDNVRGAFNDHPRERYLEGIKFHILPNIDEETNKKISSFIDSILADNNLYR